MDLSATPKDNCKNDCKIEIEEFVQSIDIADNNSHTPVKLKRIDTDSIAENAKGSDSHTSLVEELGYSSSDKTSDFSMEDPLGKRVFFRIIRNAPREKKKSNKGAEQKNKEARDGSAGMGKKEFLSYNRKEKSLEELSKKFLTLFIEKEESIISLDKITDHLGVERRRIYDIINILESLNLVSRKGKNNYKWNGFSKIYNTIHEYENIEDKTIPEIQDLDDDINQCPASLAKKREKSLEMLSIGFLKLFLHWKGVMTLEEAARKLSNYKIDDHKIKTKIRRLYDIANVFKSLGLIKKTLLETRKPAFQWIGVKGLDNFVEKIKTDDSFLLSLESNEGAGAKAKVERRLSCDADSGSKPAKQKKLISSMLKGSHTAHSSPPQLTRSLSDNLSSIQSSLFQSSLEQQLPKMFNDILMKFMVQFVETMSPKTLSGSGNKEQREAMMESIKKSEGLKGDQTSSHLLNQINNSISQTLAQMQSGSMSEAPSINNHFFSTSKKNKVDMEIDKNFVTPVIKKTFTIIHPKNPDDEETPLRQRDLTGSNSSDHVLRETTNLIKRKPSTNSLFDVSDRSSFKKIKKFDEICVSNKENLSVPFKKCQSLDLSSSELKILESASEKNSVEGRNIVKRI